VSGGSATFAAASADAATTEGSAAAAGGPATATTPALRNELRSTGMRSGTEVNLQPFQPPIVSTPFSFQAPQVADEAYTTTPAPSVAQVLQAASTDLPRHMPAGVPGAVTATATGLLLLVGAGHLLHRTGYLRRSVIR
jgi:hypothetical protein